MSSSRNTPSPTQRNALAPGLLAAVALFLSPLFIEGDGGVVIRFIVAILALIVAWFGWQAGQWWWTAVFAAVAVLWNPVWPFGFEGTPWLAVQPVAAVLFLVAGMLIKTERVG